MTSLTIPELRQKLSTGAVKSREIVDQLAARVAAIVRQIPAAGEVVIDLQRDPLRRGSRGG